MTKTKNTEVTLCQANVLTESRYDFNRIEKNCLYKIIEKVRHDYIEHPNTQTIEGFNNLHVYLPPQVLGEITDNKHKKDAHDALVSLRKRDVEIHYPDGSWLNTGFVNWVKWDETGQVYKVEVSSEIMPYLVELARNYTAYSITIAMSLKSVYSQRFYELCCQYRNNIEKDGYGGFHKTQEQLREMLCLEDKYPLNADFNRRVIYQAQEEIEKLYKAEQCDLYFTVNIKGRGKNVFYDFKIITREISERQKAYLADARAKSLSIQRDLLAIFKKDEKFVQRAMREIDWKPNLIDPLFERLDKLKREYSGSDLAKLLRYILKEDFEIK